MQRYGLRMGAICAVVIFGAGVAEAQAPKRAGACGQIIAACQQAGFERGAAKAGNGIAADCIRPIMQSRPQPRRATKPLPQVAPELVAACAAANPNFGQRTRRPRSLWRLDKLRRLPKLRRPPNPCRPRHRPLPTEARSVFTQWSWPGLSPAIPITEARPCR